MPSPTSGSLNSYATTRCPPSPVGSSYTEARRSRLPSPWRLDGRSASRSTLKIENLIDRCADALHRGEPIILQGGNRVGRIVARHPDDRRFQMKDRLLVDARHQFGSHAPRLHRFMDNHHPPGLLDGAE